MLKFCRSKPSFCGTIAGERLPRGKIFPSARALVSSGVRGAKVKSVAQRLRREKFSMAASASAGW